MVIELTWVQVPVIVVAKDLVHLVHVTRGHGFLLQSELLHHLVAEIKLEEEQSIGLRSIKLELHRAEAKVGSLH